MRGQGLDCILGRGRETVNCAPRRGGEALCRISLGFPAKPRTHRSRTDDRRGAARARRFGDDERPHAGGVERRVTLQVSKARMEGESPRRNGTCCTRPAARARDRACPAPRAPNRAAGATARRLRSFTRHGTRSRGGSQRWTTHRPRGSSTCTTRLASAAVSMAHLHGPGAVCGDGRALPTSARHRTFGTPRMSGICVWRSHRTQYGGLATKPPSAEGGFQSSRPCGCPAGPSPDQDLEISTHPAPP